MCDGLPLDGEGGRRAHDAHKHPRVHPPSPPASAPPIVVPRTKRISAQNAAWQRLVQEVHARDGRRCFVCRGQQALTVHHIVPRADGGMNELRNLMTLCEPHHTAVEDLPWADVVAYAAEIQAKQAEDLPSGRTRRRAPAAPVADLVADLRHGERAAWDEAGWWVATGTNRWGAYRRPLGGRSSLPDCPDSRQEPSTALHQPNQPPRADPPPDALESRDAIAGAI